MKVTIGDYLLNRLKELGIQHIFGVPGDYNLGFLDQILNEGSLSWIGTCNELNGAYAADGYARIGGAAALVTTFGVGELSAINGIAGAYAEYVPVVHIVGMPARSTQQRKAIVHHTFGGGDFGVFAQMYSQVSVAQTLLTPCNAANEIDRVLEIGWRKKQPIYIGIPADVSYLEIEDPQRPLDLAYPPSSAEAVEEAVARMGKLVEASQRPLILADLCAVRHPMKQLIEELLHQTGIPFATMNMGKGIIDESHPQFLGMYNGDFSLPGIQERVLASDCILAFGSLLSDFNTGGFTARLDATVTIEIHSDHVQLKHSLYPDVYFSDVIPALTQRLSSYRFSEPISKGELSEYQVKDQKVTQERFWHRMGHFLRKDWVVIAEVGTSLFGASLIPLPDGVQFVSQPLWSSIGYTVGALLGTALAAPDRQSVLFVGDGSFQVTAQEVSTMLRHGLTPVIFLINNDGYTIERIIHGPTMLYNDVQMWNYAEFPKTMGDNVWSVQVSTEAELETTLGEIPKIKGKLVMIEVMMDRNDSPEILRRIGEACAEQNKYSAQLVEVSSTA